MEIKEWDEKRTAILAAFQTEGRALKQALESRALSQQQYAEEFLRAEKRHELRVEAGEDWKRINDLAGWAGWSVWVENRTPHTVRIFHPDTPGVLPERDISTWVLTELLSVGAVRVSTLAQESQGTIQINGVSVPLVGPQKMSESLDWGKAGHPRYDGSGQLPGILVGQFGWEVVHKLYPGPVFVTDTGPESCVRGPAGEMLGIKRLALAEF